MSHGEYCLIRISKEDPEDRELCWYDNRTHRMTLDQAKETKERVEKIYGHDHEYQIEKYY